MTQTKFRKDDLSALVQSDGFAEVISRPPTTFMKDVWRNFKKRKTAIVALWVLALILLLVLIGPMISQYNYYSNDYSAINCQPGGEHWFGTDTLGRDLWVRVWQGGRISLFIAVAATLIPYLIGMTVGGFAGYFGGIVDMVIMRIIDILMGIPSLIYNILLMMVLGSGNIFTLIIAFSLTGWLGAARTTRALVLQNKERDFVMASTVLGASSKRLVFKHLIPNALGILVVEMTLLIPSVIFNEAFLSFIGLGVAPPTPSWGQLIKIASESFKSYPYQFIIPCIFVSITLLCFNLIGDGLRDALDPRLRS